MNYVYRWVMAIDGRHLFDEGHDADVKLTLDGNWESDEERIAYARLLMERLNASVPRLEPDTTYTQTTHNHGVDSSGN